MSLNPPKSCRVLLLIGSLLVLAPIGYLRLTSGSKPAVAQSNDQVAYEPRIEMETSGFTLIQEGIEPWGMDSSLAEVAGHWRNVGYRLAAKADKTLAMPSTQESERLRLYVSKAISLLYEGDAESAYNTLKEARKLVGSENTLGRKFRYTVIYLQGLAGLRLGETENCVECRGVSACILPISKEAMHQKPHGSQLAIQHFSEYLQQFPNDLGVAWLLNIAHMTLGQFPHGIDPKLQVPLDHFVKSEFDIGRFNDVAHLIGLERTNQSGGAIMDDFDNDGLLDIVVTSFDPTRAMGYYRNQGDGTFKEITQSAGLLGELGGLNCAQADYNNDGYLDIYVTRGAWLRSPIRPSLLQNNGDNTFTNVTKEAGLEFPLNSNAAQWADYDNDGHLDLFVCSELGPNRLYHNDGKGRFKNVAAEAGVVSASSRYCKGAIWLDYNGDDYPDLFINYMEGTAELYENQKNGRFADVTSAANINGPQEGFSCWAFDYDNNGRQDIFATCYRRTLADVVAGVIGLKSNMIYGRLYRNPNGTGFEDATREAGLDDVYSAMGSNFADFDGDGWLDFYLGTGEPGLGTLVPNRMFKNVGGKRFSDITGSSGTGQLQKGHGVACGDWDRDGNVDLFIEMGGAIPGDQYHNMMFQNPGHDNQWITVKLEGRKSNRSAIGARIKVVTAGDKPQTIYRWVCSGSSFGANPLQQTIGLGKATRIASLAVHWPTTKTTQVFRDLPVNQALRITEFEKAPKVLAWKPLPSPKG